ncbi:hypothetical protein D3C78_915610 [compost metagenome]
MPSLALSIRLSGNARLAMNSAMVKPIPASSPPPATSLQPRSGGRIAMPERTASQLKASTPMGLPSAKPMNTASVTESPISARDNGKPALAKAKSGMMTKPTHGCRASSSRSTGDRVSRAATSAASKVLRSLVSPLLSSLLGCATTWSRMAYRRLSLTQRRAGVIRPRITPVIVACIPDASTATQMSPPARK